MSRTKAFSAGLLAGIIAGIAMIVVMLLLACFGVATPLAIIGDRLSIFIPPGPFLALMGRVGGYNHLKQLGVGSTMAGQLVVSALGGAIFGLAMRRDAERFCVAANYRLCHRPLASFRNELSRITHRGRPVGDTGGVRAQRIRF